MRRFVTLLAAAAVVLPILGCGGGGSGENGVSKEVGDDTYVPDFKLGDIQFKNFWVPDNAEYAPGFEMDIWFDVESSQPKYNTYLKMDLVKLDVCDINNFDVGALDTAKYAPDYQLTAVTIDRLEPNVPAHKDHRFTLPSGIEDGCYAVVFSINQRDFFPEDDALQGEDTTQEANNFAAPATILIGRIDQPNLRILSQSFDNNSFELPGESFAVGADLGSALPILRLSLEVESMAQHTVDPVDVVVDLTVPGQGTFRLPFAEVVGAGETQQRLAVGAFTYQPFCKRNPELADPDTPLDPVDGIEVELGGQDLPQEVCASLFRQEQTGRTYDLYLTPAALQAVQDAVAAAGADVTCTVTAGIDPMGAVTEWKNNKADNTVDLPVVALQPGPTSLPRAARAAYAPTLGSYPNQVYKKGEPTWEGNDYFAAGYRFASGVQYAEGAHPGGRTGPVAAVFYSENKVSTKVFGYESVMLGSNIYLVEDLRDIAGNSYFEYDVTVLGTRVYGNQYKLEESSPGVVKPKSILNTGSALGYEKRKALVDKVIFVGWVPMSVRAGVALKGGVRGDILADKNNALSMTFGPFINADGFAEAGLWLVTVRGGVGGQVRLIGAYYGYGQILQMEYASTLNDGRPYAHLGKVHRLELSTLFGRIYLWADYWRLFWKGWSLKSEWKRLPEVNLVKWDGLTWNWYWPGDKNETYTWKPTNP